VTKSVVPIIMHTYRVYVYVHPLTDTIYTAALRS
jgi:hypothetical protein